MINDFSVYIGQPWAAGADGPETWDCMAFAAHIQRHHFGVDMPRITIPDYNDIKQLVLLNSTHAEQERWTQVASQNHGDLVFVRSPMHYGVWLDIDGGGVLHCVRNQGVVWTKDSAWACSGFGRKVYLRSKAKA